MFEHCHHCPKDKRYPGCQDHCPDGIADKKKYEEMKAARDKQRAISNGIYAQRSASVHKAMKRK